MSDESKFPGPGTAMAFAAAMAAGAAGYSYSNPLTCGMLIAVALVFGVFTLYIERISGPHLTKESEDKIGKLALIERLYKMSQKEIITEEEFQEKKKDILSKLWDMTVT